MVAALAGYALAEWLPEALLQLVVGTLLLIFGLQWLRKAILRSSGLKALNDEDEVYREELEAGRAAGAERHLGLDWFGFVVSFKGVFLEGLEIVFIVITFGLNADNVPLAAAGARRGGRDRAHDRRRRAPAAGQRAAEHDQVRGRPAARRRSAPSGPSRGSDGSRTAARASSGRAATSPIVLLLAAWSAFSWSAIRLLAAR